MPNLDPRPLRSVDDVDGRRARRGRNRDAVIDALLECYDEGVYSPSAADIAERSGVSHRSVFRYFSDIDEIARLAITRGHERYDPLSRIHEIGKGPLDVRIERIVDQRISLFRAMEGPARAARVHAPNRAIVKSDLIRWRLFLRAQLSRQFSPEFKQMERAEALSLLGALDVLCSFESFELLRHDQSMTVERVRETMCMSIHRLLSNGQDSAPAA